MYQFDMSDEKPSSVTTETPMYDTKEGISIFIKSLEGFNKLIAERRKAGYSQRERLYEYVILGKWWLDTCGNTSRGTPAFDDMPDVLTREEFWELLKTKYEKEEDVPSISCNPDNGIPYERLICPVCKKGWTIENAYDTWVIRRDVTICLTEHVGKTLAEIQQEFRARTDAVYGVQPEMLIQNDKYIDLTPDPEYSSLVLNKGGWLGERDRNGMTTTNEHIIEEGDKTYFNVWDFHHRHCYRIKQNQEERAKFEEVFKAAGFTNFLMKAIPNEYHGPSCFHCADWYEVTTPFADFKIGWRKRVINIECKKINPEKMFSEEDVTKWGGGIHAWGWDKAQEYLTKMYAKLAQ